MRFNNFSPLGKPENYGKLAAIGILGGGALSTLRPGPLLQMLCDVAVLLGIGYLFAWLYQKVRNKHSKEQSIRR